MAAASPATSALSLVLRDLQRIFGDRLVALVAHSPGHQPQASLALVTSLTVDDLSACAAAAAAWQRAGAATPIVIPRDEFAQSLDTFPVEFGEILVRHETVWGADPFAGLQVQPQDLRRACEGQVRSLLLHLREDYMEAAGSRAAVDSLMREAAPRFRQLLRLVTRLEGAAVADDGLAHFAAGPLGLDAATVSDLLHLADRDRDTVDAVKLFPACVAAVERLARYTDTWRR
jgi:hypothetical protein